MIAGAVFLLAFLFRLYHLDYRSIWMDEDAQAHIASRGINAGLPARAARQQQPPLDYAAESIGLFVFGWTETGARIHAALWGSFAAVLFFMLLMSSVRRPSAVTFGTVLFVTHPMLVRYSQEGRPVSCGVFFAVWWLWAFFKFVRAPRPDADLKARAVSAAIFFAASLAFILSVGFQPLVFLFVSAAALLPLLVFYPRFRRRILEMWGMMLIALAAALPILLLCLENGAHYVAPSSSFEKIASISKSLAAFSFSEWKEHLHDIADHLFLVSAVVIPLGIMGVVRKRSMRRTDRFFFAFLLLFALLYPFLFNGLYYGMVSRHYLAVRYFLSVTPALLVLLSMFFSNAAGFVQKKLAARSPLPRRLIVFVLAFGLAAAVAVPSATSLCMRYAESSRTDWRSLYALFKKKPDRFGAAYLMNLVPVGKWAPVRFYATQFYYPLEERRPIALRKIEEMIPDLRAGRPAPGADVYWVVPYGYRLLTKETLKGSKAVFHRYDRISVAHVKLGLDARRDIADVFDKMAAKVAETENNYKIFEMRAELGLMTGDKKRTVGAIKMLSRINKRGKLDKTIRKLRRRLEKIEK